MLLEEEVMHKKNFPEIQFPGEVAQHLLAVNVQSCTLTARLAVNVHRYTLIARLAVNVHTTR